MRAADRPARAENLPRQPRYSACCSTEGHDRGRRATSVAAQTGGASRSESRRRRMSRAVRAADGIWWMRTLLANVAFVGSSERWVLVDAGVGGYSGSIAAAAGELFGDDAPARGDHPDARPFRPRRQPGAAPASGGMCRYTPTPRAAVLDRALLVPAARPARRGRRDGVVIEALSARADRPGRSRAGTAGRPHRAWLAGLALDPHAGAQPGARVPRPRIGRGGDRG